MARHKNINWILPEKTTTQDGGLVCSWETIHMALLMDIRDELQEMNISLRVLRCQHFLQIPLKLDRIGSNTKKPTRKAKRGAQ